MPIKKITFIYTIFLKEDYTEPIGLKGNTRYVIMNIIIKYKFFRP